jgi:hypothetical protein
MKHALILITIFALVLGCENSEESNVLYSKRCLAVANSAKMLSEEMTKLEIDHEYSRESKCVKYPESRQEIVETAHIKVAGSPPLGLRQA